MADCGRRVHGDHCNYSILNHHGLPAAYGHGEPHEYVTNDTGHYSYPLHTFASYASQFSPPYSQHSSLSSSPQQVNSHCLSSYPNCGPSTDQIRPRQSSPYITPSRYFQPTRYLPLWDALSDSEIENQESVNELTMLSEPVIPPLDGFPDVREFDELVKSYVNDLSVKKQDKALIHAKRARNIKSVLMDPKDTAVESAQFRFWVKKMFKLQAVGFGRTNKRMICHEGKPVAIREKLFKILTKAHQQCQHGGRDKTSAQVRRIYSWVPKELISRFVKICPTCQVRRGASRLTPPNSRPCSSRLEQLSSFSTYSPRLLSPPSSRRESPYVVQPPAADPKPQPELYTPMSGVHGTHSSWMDTHQALSSRPNPSLGSPPPSPSHPLQSMGPDQQNTLRPAPHNPDVTAAAAAHTVAVDALVNGLAAPHFNVYASGCLAQGNGLGHRNF